MLNPLAHSICLAAPERLTPLTAWHEHIPFAMFLTAVLRPRMLVELGTEAGDSYCAFCQAVETLNLDTRCYAVDTWRGDAHAGGYDANVLEELRAHHEPLYGRFSALIQSTFDEALAHFSDGSIDLLHIDGYHAYESVKHDFESWLPKVSRDGLILLHDINVRQQGFGVSRLWEEIKPRYRTFEFHHGYGLGVVAVGDVTAPELQAFFNADGQEAARIRRFFFHLGRRLTLERECEKRRQAIDSLQQQLAAHDAETQQLVSQLAEQVMAADARDAELQHRRQSIEDSQTRLAAERESLLQQLHTAEAMLQSQTAEVAAQQTAWQSLAAALEKREAAERGLRAELAAKEQAMRALRLARTAEARKFTERLAAAETERRQLDHEAAQAAELFSSQIAELESQVHERERLLHEKEQQLQRITRTLGWRLLSRYGRLKYGLLMPVYHWLRGALELFTRRSYQPAIEPIHDVQQLDATRWQATGDDPQFNLVSKWPKGWTEVAHEIATDRPVSGHARLYVDRGAGYSESDSVDLGATGGARRGYVRLGPEVVALRFDPFESASVFRINRLVLKRVAARKAKAASRRKSPPRRAAALKEFMQFSVSRAESFRRKHGRAPRLGELPAAVRRTLRAWNAAQTRMAHVQNAPPAVEAPFPLPAFQPPEPLDVYDAWLEVNQWNARRAAWLGERLSAIAEPPLLSVVMPVYNAPPEFLDRAIQSVVAQVYPNWELCIADDSSTDPAINDLLQSWAEREPRLRVVYRETNGHISRATNSAAELARGDFIILLDQDDELTPDALGEIAIYITEHPDADILYSDDDKINMTGDRFAPQFKPDWSPELLLSYMYFSHVFAMRRRLYVEAGGLRAGFEGAQDYDLALRAGELTSNIHHIPKILYHWRVLPGSTAASGDAKPDSFEAGLRAVQEALERRGASAEAVQPQWAADAACGIFAHQFPDDGPRVTVIIPTRNQVAVLRDCIASLARTTYKNYEVVIIDNDSDDAETLAYLEEAGHRVLRIASPGGRFNFAALNNRAVEQIDADYVLFLNNDTEVVAPRWLSQMVGYLGLSGVGAVGARLLYADGRIQHAGIVHGYYNGMAGPAFKLLPASDHGYLSYAMVTRNYAAVTAACMLTRRELFISLGGFDEQQFAVAYNDVDYCYRLRAAGRRVVYCPAAELVHHEGHSRGFIDDPAEAAAFRRQHGKLCDPFYNPNLSLENERFAIEARTVAPDDLPPVRALLCAFNLNWEGAPQSQFELTLRLKAMGVIEPLVYCPTDGPLRAAYEANGIRVETGDHPLAGVHTLAAYEQAIERLADRIREWQIEMVYGNTLQTFYAIDAAKRLDLPSIWNPRESEPWQTYFDYLGPQIAARALQCFSYPYKVVFVAKATQQGCAALNAHHNFATIHNSPDRERFAATLGDWPRAAARQRLKLRPNEVMILLLGTVCERKGQIDLIEAMGRLNEPCAGKVRCVIVGDRAGDYSERMHGALRHLSADRQARIDVVAEASEVAPFYAAADLFVCTSRVESYPRVILEAMIAGLPIITTPVYGITEQVREEVNALFYSPGDAARLAEQITRLVEAPDLRQRLADNSRYVLAGLNDFDGMITAYARVFREAWLSGRSR
jgi:GT2 family glycosyltransferase/glycosyltransferase involved in cell wall biosynthesis